MLYKIKLYCCQTSKFVAYHSTQMLIGYLFIRMAEVMVEC